MKFGESCHRAITERFSYTYYKQYYVPRITVVSLEIVHEGLRRHVEDALLLPLQECEKEGTGYRPLMHSQPLLAVILGSVQ